jgi:hypothetical protein
MYVVVVCGSRPVMCVVWCAPMIFLRIINSGWAEAQSYLPILTLVYKTSLQSAEHLSKEQYERGRTSTCLRQMLIASLAPACCVSFPLAGRTHFLLAVGVYA